MKKDRLSIIKQDRLMEHVAAGKTARCTDDFVDVNFTTSANYCQRLHELIAYQTEQEASENFDG
ncbi:hypothetical protein N6A79_07590 [Bartonella sp. HY761]|nr:hypothetical protein [Bartonella sp. HY761]UXN05188.1 hypothetical protein N6A79_07590 [Bartonella sp. HY761]